MPTEDGISPVPRGSVGDKATPRPWKVSLPDETLILGPNNQVVATTLQDEDDYQRNCDMRAGDAALIVRAVNAHDAAMAAMREAYVTLSFAYRRLEPSARSRDGELCLSFGKARAKIESVFKGAGEKL